MNHQVTVRSCPSFPAAEQVASVSPLSLGSFSDTPTPLSPTTACPPPHSLWSQAARPPPPTPPLVAGGLSTDRPGLTLWFPGTQTLHTAVQLKVCLPGGENTDQDSERRDSTLATSPLTAKPVSLWPTGSGQVACRDRMHRDWEVSALTLPVPPPSGRPPGGQVQVLVADTVGCFQVSCHCPVGLRSLFLQRAPEGPLRRPSLARQAATLTLPGPAALPS